MLIVSRHVVVTEVIKNVVVKAKTKAAATAKVKRRQCLDCGKAVDESERYIMGNCHACYQSNYRDIATGVTTPDKLLSEGRQMKLPAGRPRKTVAAKKNRGTA